MTNFTKRIFVGIVALAAAVPMMRADKSWHIVTDAGDKIPVSAVECIVEDADVAGFNIILSIDNIVYRGVMRTSFEYIEEAGITPVSDQKETIMGPYCGLMTLKGLRAGTIVCIYNSQGALMDRIEADGTCQIDTSAYPGGVYVLSTGRTNVKFIKH